MRIAELRKSKNLTQAELAAAIGVDQTAVHMWEAGKNNPRFKHLQKLAIVLECTIDDLMSEPQDPSVNGSAERSGECAIS